MVKSQKNVSSKHTTITIPKTLFALLEERMEKTGFASVSSYSTYILRQTITRMIEEDIRKDKGSKQDQVIVEKLRKLGYV